VTRKRLRLSLSQSAMSKYCQKVLNCPAAMNVSVYKLTCEALAKDGFVKPADISDKNWVKNNWAYICASIGKPHKAIEKSKPKPSLTVTAVGKSKVYTVRNPEYKYDKNSDQHLFYASNDFLQSYEWRRVRMEAIKKYGAKCQCCGATPAQGAIINVDHIKPRKLYPELALTVSNLQVLCHECNHGKGNWDMTDWRKSQSNTCKGER
jgi:5-methylcytosine-specific restriction endonuclease McrA